MPRYDLANCTYFVKMFCHTDTYAYFQPLKSQEKYVAVIIILRLNILQTVATSFSKTYRQIERETVKDHITTYSKTCLKWPLSKRPKIGFQDQLSLNAGQKYCRMLQGEILQYFRPSLSYHLSLRYMFCLFLSDRFRQVLLYIHVCKFAGLLKD